jgi:hypothetical protein
VTLSDGDERPGVGPPNCLFCGAGGKRTKEHAWPRWMAEVLPGQGAFTHAVMAPKRGPWRSAGLDIQVRCVCARCNSTWMSKLEQSARPVLTKLIQDAPAELTVEQQATLAGWSFKTGIVLQRAGEGPFVPAPHRKWLLERGAPPPSVTILLGRHVGSSWVTAFASGALHLLPGERTRRSAQLTIVGYVLTLGAGALVIQVIHEGVGPALSVPVPHSIQIWPTPRAPRKWPPAASFDDETFTRFAGRTS